MTVKAVMHNFIKYFLIFDSLVHKYFEIIKMAIKSTMEDTIIAMIKKYQFIKFYSQKNLISTKLIPRCFK